MRPVCLGLDRRGRRPTGLELVVRCGGKMRTLSRLGWTRGTRGLPCTSTGTRRRRSSSRLLIQDLASTGLARSRRAAAVVTPGTWPAVVDGKTTGCALGLAHLFPDSILLAVIVGGVLVEGYDVHHRLWISLLVLSRNTRLLKQLLPFLGQSSEFARVRVETDMRQVYWVIGRRDFDLLLG